MVQFTDFNLPQALNNALAAMQFTTPTPIQEKTIPLILGGRDVLGTAQTGTGKTGAFAIPIIARLLSQPRGSALILTPTRELAAQVSEVFEKLLGRHSQIKTALLIGGESMPKQLNQLRMRPRVIVGTPGRVNDHLERGSLLLHDAGILVLDETDRMLDMGFGVQIDRILKFVPQTRQTLLFSATLPQAILKLSERYLKNPERIAIGAANQAKTQITQEIVRTTQEQKYAELTKQLDARTGSIIVFVKTKWGAERLAQRLSRQHHSADAIHGDLRQRQRDRVIEGFREKQYRILVATDIAARGLDIPHIEHVINYDLPQAPEDYIHRIGRTARAGAEGSALSLIAPEDNLKWRAIERLINPNAANDDRRGHAGQGQRHEGQRDGHPRKRRRNRNRFRHRQGQKQAA